MIAISTNESAAAAGYSLLFQVERLDHVADHLTVGAAEEFGVDVVAGRRDEGEQRSRTTPGAESGKVTLKKVVAAFA